MVSSGDVISHWHHSFEDFNISTTQFYSTIEMAIKLKDAPIVRTERVQWHESGVLSAKREYLRISYGRLSFDICAAPFGKDYFFSWWLAQRRENVLIQGCLTMVGVLMVYGVIAKYTGAFVGLLITFARVFTLLSLFARGHGEISMIVEDLFLSIPVVGALYERFIKTTTYYSTDSRIMFEEFVHQIVVHEIKALVEGKGIKALSPEQLKPTSRSALA